MPMKIYIACSLYKLVHKSKYLHCSKMFVVNKIAIHVVLQDLKKKNVYCVS